MLEIIKVKKPAAGLQGLMKEEQEQQEAQHSAPTGTFCFHLLCPLNRENPACSLCCGYLPAHICEFACLLLALSAAVCILQIKVQQCS